MMTNQLTGNGHRWDQRIAADIPGQVTANDSPAIHGHLKNLRLSGALLEANHELGLHAYIEVGIKRFDCLFRRRGRLVLQRIRAL
jgi:hypothetical protein